ncbi:uncharacterized protein LOC103523454 [Diaphorina citri]|uniref:Uncharacterized protein LOC103523454 n=1 Tax=Diaphorina citri TaxID=121845 RepID=A0A1S3DSC5_DIACI|nr:uncharacterized protein LOC103523454 [Diaphorina citri]
MKSEMSSINTGLAAFRSPPPNLPQSMTSTPSRLGLGGRKASLNRVRESPGDESTESSQENLVTYGTPGSALGSALGSLDELDTSAVIDTNAAPGGKSLTYGGSALGSLDELDTSAVIDTNAAPVGNSILYIDDLSKKGSKG